MRITTKQFFSAMLSGLLILGSPGVTVLAQNEADAQSIFTDAEEVSETFSDESEDTMQTENVIEEIDLKEDEVSAEEFSADHPEEEQTGEFTEEAAEDAENFVTEDFVTEDFSAEDFTEEEFSDELLSEGSVSGVWTYELSSTGLTITAYTGSASKVTIPTTLKGYKVIGIGRRAFANNTTLKTITIPATIETIGAEAFCNCSSLSTINFNAKNCTVPSIWRYDSARGVGVFSGAGSASGKGLTVNFGDGVIKVPDGLFKTASLSDYGMNGYAYAYVTTVNFADSVTEIGDSAFRNCRDLTSVNLGKGIETIGTSAFEDCVSVTELITTNQLNSIGNYAFDSCTSLKKITFGSGLKSIGIRAFAFCSSLTSITLPKKLGELKAEAFRDCTKLNSITINSVDLSVPSVWRYDDARGVGVFSGAGSASGKGLTVTFGSGVTKVPEGLFKTASLSDYGMNGYAYAYVTTVKFADSVTEIGDSAFRNCRDLTSVNLGKGIETIGTSAFEDCVSVTELTTTNQLNSIGNYAFNSCTSLKKITLGSGLKSIGIRAFAFCSSLTSITLPKKLEELKAEAFRDCTKLNSITINSVNLSVPSVWRYDDARGVGVFSGAGSASVKGLTVTFGSGVTKVPEGLFKTASLSDYGINGYAYAYVTEVEFADSVTTIGDSAFRNCRDLTSVKLGKGIETIGTSAFEDCVGVTELTTTKQLNSIGNYAFDSCTSLKKITLGSGLKSIGVRAFAFCSSLTSITLPENLEELKAEAFRDCTKLNSITINSVNLSVPSVWRYDDARGVGVFSGAGSASVKGLAVTFGSKVTKIPDNLFKTASLSDYGMNGYAYAYITSVTIPSGVAYIGADAFRNCQQLEKVKIQSTKAEFGSGAFSGCTDVSFKITAYYGSTAITYAKDNSFNYGYLTPVKPELSGVSKVTAGVKFSWKKSTGAQGYIVYRKASGESEWTKLETVSRSTASYTDKSVKSGIKYTYTVRAYAGNLKSSYDKTGLSVIYLASPVLGEIGNTLSGITVRWAKVTGAGGYIVYRKTSGASSWTELAKVGAGATGYTDKTVKSGTTYTYTVRAYAGDVKSACDSTGKTMKCLARPTLGSISNTGTGITVKWNKVTGAGGYYVYRKTAGDSSWKQLAQVSGSAVSYTDKNITSGNTYVYTIRAYSGSTKSAYDQTGLTLTYLSSPTISSVGNAVAGITVKWSKVSGASGYYVYRGTTKIKTITSASTLTYTDTAVKSNNGTKYQYKIVAYKSVSGTAAVSAGSAVKTIYRVTAPALSSVKNTASKTITAAWSKNTKATGYQIQYSTSSSFASVKTATITSASTVSKVIGSLTKGKKYYVRVRAYKTVSGTKYYSAWSGAKSVTVSK